ncbi:hypothetical protein ACM66Z_00260 [Sulfurovum sp. ST-21]|uniref:Mannose-1-phosphate guanyltransferase C-terminal domain-containing protein n=1 Tax=Sulfurovum indicum TaxID=2779528 RepID=A0A7M1S4N5_9BACT|nr:hypothetical protein [Sulfurovum indicum]QOR61961.1 hypothetical protein IMZ28_00260 [Sulfurovum indicum]
MNLCIMLDKTDYESIWTEPVLHPEAMSIAGKEIIQYWLEWARFKGIEKLYIYTESEGVASEKIDMLETLYGVAVVYLHPSKNIEYTENTYRGLGVFLDSGEYRTIKDLDSFLKLERALIQEPLKYSSTVGYGKFKHIQIGKNVYIHKSAKLSGAVVIGDNCIIEKDVEIRDSVINSGSLLKRGSVIDNSHIGKNIHLATNVYLKEKALFESTIYDMVKRESVVHEGICLKS